LIIAYREQEVVGVFVRFIDAPLKSSISSMMTHIFKDKLKGGVLLGSLWDTFVEKQAEDLLVY
jgi:hypothetical protein